MLMLRIELRFVAHKTTVLTIIRHEPFTDFDGGNRESNSGPSAPKAEIIPLDYYPKIPMH